MYIKIRSKYVDKPTFLCFEDVGDFNYDIENRCLHLKHKYDDIRVYVPIKDDEYIIIDNKEINNESMPT